MINKIFFQDKTICTSPNLSIASVVDAVDALHVAGQRPVESRHPQLLPWTITGYPSSLISEQNKMYSWRKTNRSRVVILESVTMLGNHWGPALTGGENWGWWRGLIRLSSRAPWLVWCWLVSSSSIWSPPTVGPNIISLQPSFVLTAITSLSVWSMIQATRTSWHSTASLIRHIFIVPSLLSTEIITSR